MFAGKVLIWFIFFFENTRLNIKSFKRFFFENAR
jgi:hypothetical protein